MALEAIHQGHRRFSQLGLVRIIYAFTKLVGALCVIYSGVSLEKALLANVASSLVGMMCLLPGLRLQVTGQWLVRISPILATAAAIGIYSLAELLTGSLNLWTLKIVSPASEAAMIGVFVAAMNIARVPAFALSSVCIVLLPSVSKAAAANDVWLIKRYMNQALRFLFILYLPICVVLTTRPEELMLWVYSDKFAGGGVLLSILLVNHGLAAIHGILSSMLIATGQARKLAAIASLSVIPSLLISVICIYPYGSLGAAVAGVINLLIRVLLFGLLLRQQYGGVLQGQSMVNIALAGTLMFLVNALLPRAEGIFILLHVISVAVYFVALILFDEIGRQDLAVFWPRQKSSNVG
jgi:O-antigen/teichoic acid export membrane protein